MMVDIFVFEVVIRSIYLKKIETLKGTYIVNVSQLKKFSDQVIFKLKNAKLNLGIWNFKMTRYVHVASYFLANFQKIWITIS